MGTTGWLLHHGGSNFLLLALSLVFAFVTLVASLLPFCTMLGKSPSLFSSFLSSPPRPSCLSSLLVSPLPSPFFSPSPLSSLGFPSSAPLATILPECAAMATATLCCLYAHRSA